jgi:hypothetical protein
MKHVPTSDATQVTDGHARPGRRDPRLDFFRGLAMLIILVAHIPYNRWANWLPSRFGFSDATEIFVFCSGMASAIAFGSTFRRAGWPLGTARTLFRIWQVYWAHIGLFFFTAMAMAALDASGQFDVDYIGRLNLVPFFDDPATQIIGLFTLTYVPNYFDVLPMYLVILAMIPVMMAVSQVRIWLVFALSLSVWLAANFGLLDLPAEPWSDRVWFFNPFGWQLIFFTGFAFLSGWLPRPPYSRTLVWIAIAYLVLTSPFSSGHVVGWLKPVWPAAAQWAMDVYPGMHPFRAKTEFGILRYLHFLSLAYVCWLAAGDDGRRLTALCAGSRGRIWRAVFSVVTRVGQQSLAVFVFSMALAMLLGAVLDLIGRNAPTIALVNLAGLAMIIGVAYLVAWIKSAPWRPKHRDRHAPHPLNPGGSPRTPA